MSTCVKCGTLWTSPGMVLCPICGTKVEDAARVPEPSMEQLQPEPLSVKEAPVEAAAHKTNGSAVLRPPTEVRRPKTRLLPPEEPSPSVPAPEPEKLRPAATLMPEKATGPISVDASVLMLKPPTNLNTLPTPARPLNAPLILGVLALVSAIALPVTMVFEGHRIMGILGFCLSGFFLPFAPIAWMAGMSAEKRRREQNLRPERRVVVGRLLGQASTLLLVAELSVGLLLIAGLRLAGSFPPTFWKTQQLW